LEQKSGNLREHPSKDQFIEADNLVLESKQKEELQLEVKWQTASTNSEENTMLVKVHASDDVEAVRLIFKTDTNQCTLAVPNIYFPNLGNFLKLLSGIKLKSTDL
jgi:hypothetical protein